LELDAEEHCTISGNDALLESLIRNLVDNAIRYSPAQSRIVVALSRREARVLLVVQDSGPGLSQSDIGRLGERFFRAGAAGQPGSGLGWSIIRRIAAVHGADVAASPSSMLGGLSVQVSFPASSVDANQPAPR
jgi:two-component system sensor histidine kinase QseC